MWEAGVTQRVGATPCAWMHPSWWLLLQGPCLQPSPPLATSGRRFRLPKLSIPQGGSAGATILARNCQSSGFPLGWLPSAPQPGLRLIRVLHLPRPQPPPTTTPG